MLLNCVLFDQRFALVLSTRALVCPNLGNHNLDEQLVRGHGPQHLNGTFGPGVPAEQISRFRKTVNLWVFWIFVIFWIFQIFGQEMAEKLIFPVGDHFPRPYDANFLRPGNDRKIYFSGGGPLSETLRC